MELIRKTKAKYCNETLTSSTNKSKMSLNIINSEIGTASNKKFPQTEFKLGIKTISMKQPAKSFNNYFLNSVVDLITRPPKTESVIFSLRESCPHEFPQIINIPITGTEDNMHNIFIKNENSCGFDGLSNTILKLCGSQISKPLTFTINH